MPGPARNACVLSFLCAAHGNHYDPYTYEVWRDGHGNFNTDEQITQAAMEIQTASMGKSITRLTDSVQKLEKLYLEQGVNDAGACADDLAWTVSSITRAGDLIARGVADCPPKVRTTDSACAGDITLTIASLSQASQRISSASRTCASGFHFHREYKSSCAEDITASIKLFSVASATISSSTESCTPPDQGGNAFGCVVDIVDTVDALANAAGVITDAVKSCEPPPVPQASVCRAPMTQTNFSSPPMPLPVIPPTAACPVVGTLPSTIVDRTDDGALSVACKWSNVRFATIDSGKSTGHTTSGTGFDITYGDWGPAAMATEFEVIPSAQYDGSSAGAIHSMADDFQSNSKSESGGASSIACLQVQAGNIIGQADCLGLQIYAPPGATNLPVAIWIHGGIYMVGSSDEWMYEGSRLSSRGLVVVYINYRVNSMGFSLFDEVTRNNGCWDQRVGIQWVHKNIANFGGDPDNIGIFGESAGATSVTLQGLYELNYVPEAERIIKRIIIESSPIGISLENPEHKAAQWRNFEMKKGPAECLQTAHCLNGVCSTADAFQCMKNNGIEFVQTRSQAILMSELMPPSAVLQNLYGYGPCLDGKFVKHQPFNDVNNLIIPTIQGINREEGGLFGGMIKSALDSFGISMLDLDKKPGLVDFVMALFFGVETGSHYYAPGEGYARMARPFTDFVFGCHFQGNMGKEKGPVYRYQIWSQDACSLITDEQCTPDEICIGISCHANELPAVFNTWSEDPWKCCKEDDKYSLYFEQMMHYWSVFLMGGEPWDAKISPGYVKVLGMTAKGEICDEYRQFELNANIVYTGVGKLKSVCEHFEWADEPPR